MCQTVSAAEPSGKVIAGNSLDKASLLKSRTICAPGIQLGVNFNQSAQRALSFRTRRSPAKADEEKNKTYLSMSQCRIFSLLEDARAASVVTSVGDTLQGTSHHP